MNIAQNVIKIYQLNLKIIMLTENELKEGIHSGMYTPIDWSKRDTSHIDKMEQFVLKNQIIHNCPIINGIKKRHSQLRGYECKLNYEASTYPDYLLNISY